MKLMARDLRLLHIVFSYWAKQCDNNKNTPNKCWIMIQNVPANTKSWFKSTPANAERLFRNASKLNEELWLHMIKSNEKKKIV